MAEQKRRRLFIDIEVQIALLGRVVTYWITFAVAALLMQFCWVVFTGQPTSSVDLMRQALMQCGPAILASALLIPLVMVDSLRLSNRFVGPVYRLRRGLRDLSQGLDVQPIRLRRDDFWVDIVDDFNRLAASRRAEGVSSAAAEQQAGPARD